LRVLNYNIIKQIRIKFILTGISFILFFLNSIGQTSKEVAKEILFSNNLKLNIFELLSSRPVLSIQYERLISPGISLLCNFNFMYSSSSVTYNGYPYSSGSIDFLRTNKGWGVQPAIRYYPSYGGAPRGFYVAGFVYYFSESLNVSSSGSITQNFSGTLDNINSIGIGAILGWKWVIRNSFTIDAGIGGGYLSVTSPSSYLTILDANKNVVYQEASPEQTRTSLSPNAELSLGFIF